MGRLLLLVLAAVVPLVACGTAAPRITFTEIPPAAAGGPVRTATIAGRVEGARPGDRIVLFAKSHVWYVQPMRHNPFTELDADGRWRSTIHLGTVYAAMVVRDDYRPPDTTASLPELNSRVVAIRPAPCSPPTRSRRVCPHPETNASNWRSTTTAKHQVRHRPTPRS